MKRSAGAAELLDGELDPSTLAGNLCDLGRLNRWLGGAALTWRALEPLLAPRSAAPLRFLDIGTGAGDIPRNLLRRAPAGSLEIVATDIRPEILAVARATSGQPPTFEVRSEAAGQIDAADGSFDVVHSSMVIHHLDPEAATAGLREMARAARRAVIVNDLDRRLLWLALARTLTTVATRNPYTRHDAPLSVRRAYRPAELVERAREAGLREEARYWAVPPYRYAIVFVRA